MPGNSWRDLKRNSSSDLAPLAQQNARSKDVSANTSVSPKLAGLQEKRKQLEQQMFNLGSGAGESLSPRDAARFQVPSFAERQAQQREWENKRERLQTRAAELRNQAGNNTPSERLQSPSASANSVNQWLAQRDSDRSELRNASRDRLSPLNGTSRIGRQLKNSLSQTSRQLQQLDQQLAEHGLDKERKELRSLGANKISQASSQLNKYTEMADNPLRAISRLDSSWKSHQQRISGAMDQVSSYVDRSQARLSTETGGSGNIFERMDRNRNRALEQRKIKQREEARDEARRNRAKRNKHKEI